MKPIKICILLLLTGFSAAVKAQEIPEKTLAAIQADDTTSFAAQLTNVDINACYGNYSLLSQTVRNNAMKCFNLLIARGADVNKSCNGYVPPLMHAAKYGNLEMVKILVAKGADINYKYTGDYAAANGQTPITYAELYKHTDIADYLRSVKQ